MAAVMPPLEPVLTRHRLLLGEWMRLVRDPAKRQQHQEHLALVGRWKQHRQILETVR